MIMIKTLLIVLAIIALLGLVLLSYIIFLSLFQTALDMHRLKKQTRKEIDKCVSAFGEDLKKLLEESLKNLSIGIEDNNKSEGE